MYVSTVRVTDIHIIHVYTCHNTLVTGIVRMMSTIALILLTIWVVHTRGEDEVQLITTVTSGRHLQWWFQEYSCTVMIDESDVPPGEMAFVNSKMRMYIRAPDIENFNENACTMSIYIERETVVGGDRRDNSTDQLYSDDYYTDARYNATCDTTIDKRTLKLRILEPVQEERTDWRCTVTPQDVREREIISPIIVGNQTTPYHVTFMNNPITVGFDKRTDIRPVERYLIHNETDRMPLRCTFDVGTVLSATSPLSVRLIAALYDETNSNEVHREVIYGEMLNRPYISPSTGIPIEDEKEQYQFSHRGGDQTLCFFGHTHTPYQRTNVTDNSAQEQNLLWSDEYCMDYDAILHKDTYYKLPSHRRPNNTLVWTNDILTIDEAASTGGAGPDELLLASVLFNKSKIVMEVPSTYPHSGLKVGQYLLPYSFSRVVTYVQGEVLIHPDEMIAYLKVFKYLLTKWQKVEVFTLPYTARNVNNFPIRCTESKEGEGYQILYMGTSACAPKSTLTVQPFAINAEPCGVNGSRFRPQTHHIHPDGPELMLSLIITSVTGLRPMRFGMPCMSYTYTCFSHKRTTLLDDIFFIRKTMIDGAPPNTLLNIHYRNSVAQENCPQKYSNNISYDPTNPNAHVDVVLEPVQHRTVISTAYPLPINEVIDYDVQTVRKNKEITEEELMPQTGCPCGLALTMTRIDNTITGEYNVSVKDIMRFKSASNWYIWCEASGRRSEKVPPYTLVIDHTCDLSTINTTGLVQYQLKALFKNHANLLTGPRVSVGKGVGQWYNNYVITMTDIYYKCVIPDKPLCGLELIIHHNDTDYFVRYSFFLTNNNTIDGELTTKETRTSSAAPTAMLDDIQFEYYINPHTGTTSISVYHSSEHAITYVKGLTHMNTVVTNVRLSEIVEILRDSPRVCEDRHYKINGTYRDSVIRITVTTIDGCDLDFVSVPSLDGTQHFICYRNGTYVDEMESLTQHSGTPDVFDKQVYEIGFGSYCQWSSNGVVNITMYTGTPIMPSYAVYPTVGKGSETFRRAVPLLPESCISPPERYTKLAEVTEGTDHTAVYCRTPPFMANNTCQSKSTIIGTTLRIYRSDVLGHTIHKFVSKYDAVTGCYVDNEPFVTCTVLPQGVLFTVKDVYFLTAVDSHYIGQGVKITGRCSSWENDTYINVMDGDISSVIKRLKYEPAISDDAIPTVSIIPTSQLQNVVYWSVVTTLSLVTIVMLICLTCVSVPRRRTDMLEGHS